MSTVSADTPKRLFLAIWPPEAVVAALRQLPRPTEPGVRWVPPETWHVTLRFFGEADPGEITAHLEGARLPAAEAALGPQVARLGRSVIVVPVSGLDDLADAARAATEGVGSFDDPRPFAGHLTLARLRNRSACGVAGTPVTARFDVDEIALVASTPTQDGPTYTTLGSFPVPSPGHRDGDPSPAG